MKAFDTLETHLSQQVLAAKVSQDIVDTVLAIATAAQRISTLIGRGRLAGNLDANEIILAALEDAPVAWVVSEELEQPAQGKVDAPLVVAMNPLDGSSNIETNTAVGTIFSILPACADVDAPVAASVLQPGSRQLAAGYIIYGPQTALVLTLGNGTQLFTLDRENASFYLSDPAVQIPETTREFAINVSNFRHWDRPVRTYIDDCLNGEDGYRDDNYNMRWLASLVAECHRILSRGGVFLYPSDARKGYAAGRLRLLYEVSPIAFLVEQAGGAATSGLQRLLDIEPANIHERAPMIFGSRREIARIERYYDASGTHAERSQLFNKRGLFRA